MKANASFSRTLVVLAVGLLVAVAVALSGVGLRSAETQTTAPTYYKVQDLGTLPGATYFPPTSKPSGINDRGHVVGYAVLSSFTYYEWGYPSEYVIGHPFLLKDGVMTDLGLLGWGSGGATAINNAGHVVGNSVDGNWISHAFLYKDGVMTELGTLGGTDSQAYAINDSGQVVGQASTSDGARHAFLYQNEKMIDLGTRTHPDQNGNVWTLDTARGINNNGQIMIGGSRVDQNGTDVNSALLLTPTSDPPPGDSQPPSAPTISSPQNYTYDKDGSFSVSGSAEASSTVELFEGTTSKGTTKADSSSGAWSIDLSGVSDGSHTYTARATDAAGNSSSASNSVTVTVDTASPETNMASGPSGPTNDNTPTFSFSGSDNLSQGAYLRYSYKVDGSAWSSYSFETSVTLGGASGLSEGSHTFFYVKARDEAANEDQSPAQRSFTVDTTQPMVVNSSTTPQSGATGVGRGTHLTASFSEKMGASTVNTTTFKLYKVNADGTQTQITDVVVSLSNDGLTATLNPFGAKTTLLARSTKYKGVITTGTKDLAGNPLAQQMSWTFITTKS